ncbi:monofunctional biosynthetic peptidoglycan transglycosylase [Aestuariivivens sediminicola]|uniref:monofunctional biosynthetic peptidoglycan transglycosylase n=1 Tax=Aestuariivivens sediminicola TaxID=2913560 RepID=UPI001F594EB2|nr:monofunctional biosynthetic peptidoglycan transglycosylase [Aestuariivivens sediminicola]
MLKRVFRLLLKCMLWFFILSIALVILFKWIPVPFTPLMIIRYLETPASQRQSTWEHDWIPLQETSPFIQLAVICSEDQNFMSHNGFDLKAIEKAMKDNNKGKSIRGGSTISQQTAKNVFLWPQRSWLRKGLEAYFTCLIELLWNKQRIMEVYLNSVEMGDGIYGIEAASRYWFGKAASKLTRDEAAAIAAILPNPRHYKAVPATQYIHHRKTWILKQMGFYGNLKYNDN